MNTQHDVQGLLYRARIALGAARNTWRTVADIRAKRGNWEGIPDDLAEFYTSLYSREAAGYAEAARDYRRGAARAARDKWDMGPLYTGHFLPGSGDEPHDGSMYAHADEGYEELDYY